MSPLTVMKGLWGAWIISWVIAALWSDRAAARPKANAEILYRLLTMASALLLFDSGHHLLVPAGPQFWRVPTLAGWGLVGLTALALSFCWWARIHLGRMWSSSVTRKADHRIVDTGPYALVRHPIYTGMLTAAAALGVAEGTPAGLVGFGLMVLGFWVKARLEERFLRSELGPEAYDAYAQRTGMLFPGL